MPEHLAKRAGDSDIGCEVLPADVASETKLSTVERILLLVGPQLAWYQELYQTPRVALLPRSPATASRAGRDRPAIVTT